ncbi:hypothetical protein BP5796_11247 [Coleophoma crateriformis]|uniref:Uncharacterized protein n=1 Tax=Coleophoma crateriformis TaxID=565419 RepID=A0A3D8QHS2_9HELO|nr:hypothetical protein BP5796_11247 [Coleophoma crateriformis]
MTNFKKRKFNHDSGTELFNQKNWRPTEEPRVDPTYGQRSAIPGLDNVAYRRDEEEFSYDDDMDALSYLRAVRQEAAGVPNLLVAPKPTANDDGPDHSIYDDGVGDHRGWYEGGAYVAAPVLDSGASKEYTETGRDPQLVYFDSILARFEALRAKLSRTPPPEAVQNLDGDHPVYLPSSDKDAFAKWSWTLKNRDPVPVQLASIDKGTTFRLLGMLTKGSMLKRGRDVDECVSRWLWGLLARVPDQGQLSNIEVSTVRELGKKAVLVGVGFKEAQEWGDGIDEVEAEFDGEGPVEYEVDSEEGPPLEEGDSEHVDQSMTEEAEVEPPAPAQSVSGVQQESPTTIRSAIQAEHESLDLAQITAEGQLESSAEIQASNAESEDFAAAKARVLAGLLSHQDDAPEPEDVASRTAPSPSLNTRATLDMIITVAGELYGQRDLLEFREMWEESSRVA